MKKTGTASLSEYNKLSKEGRRLATNDAILDNPKLRKKVASVTSRRVAKAAGIKGRAAKQKTKIAQAVASNPELIKLQRQQNAIMRSNPTKYNEQTMKAFDNLGIKLTK